MTRAVPIPEINPISNGGIGGKRRGNTAKRSGTYFEKQAERYFDDKNIGHARRIIGSGAFGRVSNDPRLFGDLYIKYRILKKPILCEAKFGYSAGGEKQITVKKAWFDKIAQEASLTDRYPAVLLKFKGERGPTSRIIAFTWETWTEIIEELTKIIEEDLQNE
jgi:hypothetical protein